MRIGVKMQQNVTGARETRDYVTFVRPSGPDIEVEFVYTADPPMVTAFRLTRLSKKPFRISRSKE